MLKDYLGKYYFDGNYNCAESIIHAANEYYGLGLAEKDMKLLSAYGAGMQTGNTCGAILSCMSVLSLKYVETKAHESKDIKPVCVLLSRKFKERLGSTKCSELKPQYFKPEVRCLQVVNDACDVLEETLAEYVPAE